MIFSWQMMGIWWTSKWQHVHVSTTKILVSLLPLVIWPLYNTWKQQGFGSDLLNDKFLVKQLIFWSVGLELLKSGEHLHFVFGCQQSNCLNAGSAIESLSGVGHTLSLWLFPSVFLLYYSWSPAASCEKAQVRFPTAVPQLLSSFHIWCSETSSAAENVRIAGNVSGDCEMSAAKASISFPITLCLLDHEVEHIQDDVLMLKELGFGTAEPQWKACTPNEGKG